MSPISDDLQSDPPAGAEATNGKDLLEVEVKFLLEGLDGIRQRLLSAGADLSSPRVYERNIRFDTPDGALLQRQELLRLRQDTRSRLTFKGPAAEDTASEAKVREEIELEIGDFERLSTILQRLGFMPVQVYEKYRETYHWRNVEIVLDEMPFGDFIELEGKENDLKAVASALGLDWSKRVLANYLGLMELCRLSFELPFTDLTFGNFEGYPVDLGRLLPVCVLLDMEGE